MRVVGLDTSLTRTGIGVIDATTRQTHSYSVVTKEPVQETIVSRLLRIEHITESVISHIDDPDETLVVIEGNAQSSRLGKVWDRAGLWWNIVFTLDVMNLRVAICPPNTRAKWATGKGNAGKDEVMLCVDRLWRGIASNNDEADALALATMGAQYLGWPVRSLSRHAQALAAVEWPNDDQVEALRWPVTAVQGGPRVITPETTQSGSARQPGGNAGKVGR